MFIIMKISFGQSQSTVGFYENTMVLYVQVQLKRYNSKVF